MADNAGANPQYTYWRDGIQWTETPIPRSGWEDCVMIEDVAGASGVMTIVARFRSPINAQVWSVARDEFHQRVEAGCVFDRRLVAENRIKAALISRLVHRRNRIAWLQMLDPDTTIPHHRRGLERAIVEADKTIGEMEAANTEHRTFMMSRIIDDVGDVPAT